MYTFSVYFCVKIRDLTFKKDVMMLDLNKDIRLRVLAMYLALPIVISQAMYFNPNKPQLIPMCK